jgi:ribosome-binding factor A
VNWSGGKMHFSRIDRLQSQMIKELALIVEEDLKDRPPHMLTFIRSEISRDLRYAKVYFSVLGGGQEIETSMEFLKRHAGIIKKIMGKRMRIKHVPEISYIYDEAGESVSRIGEILDRLKDESDES